jgi:RNA-splicing ligase RtcB
MKDLKIFTDNIEEQAVKDIDAFMNLDAFKDSKVRIMPDVHAGKGCVIGFTATIKDKIIPNVVGVDIGCGMYCVPLGKIELDLEKIDKVIREKVPHGQSAHDSSAEKFISVSLNRSDILIGRLECYKELKNVNHLLYSIGTLGGGNHFIEIDVDDEGNKYLVIHTGSRNLGKQVCEIYQRKAIKNCSRVGYYDEFLKELVRICKESGNAEIIPSVIKSVRTVEKMETIPDDLCYVDGELMNDYLFDMGLCQHWAMRNRETIAAIIWENAIWDGKYSQDRPVGFHTMHNYLDIQNMIVRKGAISAQKDETVLIPMNMRDGSLLCIGKGNEDWNCSAPHGAGRIMSRAKAKETLNLDDYKSSMNGIFTTSVSKDTLDEAPMVYKPMDEIISKIGDTVDIVKIIKPIYNFKSSN